MHRYFIYFAYDGKNYHGWQIQPNANSVQEEMMNALATLKAHNKNVREISAEEMHVLLSAYVTALFEPLVHDWPIEKAIHNLRVVEEFFTPGWKKIMGF